MSAKRGTYTIAEVDALTSRARELLEQLRGVIGEIGERMEALGLVPGEVPRVEEQSDSPAGR